MGVAGTSSATTPVSPPTSAPLLVDQRVVRIAGEDRYGGEPHQRAGEGGLRGELVLRS